MCLCVFATGAVQLVFLKRAFLGVRLKCSKRDYGKSKSAIWDLDIWPLSSQIGSIWLSGATGRVLPSHLLRFFCPTTLGGYYGTIVKIPGQKCSVRMVTRAVILALPHPKPHTWSV